MNDYYTTIIILSWLALGVLCVLVHENSWIPRAKKGAFYLAYGLIALSALAEWVGVRMGGDPGAPRGALMAVKCADYILTPMAGGAIVSQMNQKSRGYRMMIALLAFNVAFQLLACLNGWVIVIDENNYYSHGPLYGVYIAVCMLVIVLVTIEFLLYGRSHYQQNRASLYAVLVLLIVGIIFQEISGGQYRTAYITLSLGSCLMYIHYEAFYLIAADEHIRQQQKQIAQDVLTGMLSRNAYTTAMKALGEAKAVPAELAVFTIDINELKTVNDSMGHDAGDALIIGAARCIEAAFKRTSRRYRTGGDEFVVLANMNKNQAEAVLHDLDYETARWSNKAGMELSLSAGYALAKDHPDMTAEQLVHESDLAMYAAKAEYYQSRGLNRRGTR
ncbi:MAG: GGDEF domain-containing protein [Clostridia bacterium]|nr:GGDEF domain-containing protein [Clostridia bacterium]